MKKLLIIAILLLFNITFSQELKQQVKGLFMSVEGKKLPVFKDEKGYYFILDNNKKHFKINGKRKRTSIK